MKKVVSGSKWNSCQDNVLFTIKVADFLISKWLSCAGIVRWNNGRTLP